MPKAKLPRPNLALLPLALLAILTASAWADATQKALEAAFPEARRFEKNTLFLDQAEQERVAKLAQAPMETGLVAVHRALAEGGTVTGYAFIDSRTVRTKTATFLVALTPAGEVRQVRILGWHEPNEYRPGERWLAQFRDQPLAEELRLGGRVQAMSGASFTSRTLTDGVRRLLAVHRVKLAGKE